MKSLPGATFLKHSTLLKTTGQRVFRSRKRIGQSWALFICPDQISDEKNLCCFLANKTTMQTQLSWKTEQRLGQCHNVNPVCLQLERRQKQLSRDRDLLEADRRAAAREGEHMTTVLGHKDDLIRRKDELLQQKEKLLKVSVLLQAHKMNGISCC